MSKASGTVGLALVGAGYWGSKLAAKILVLEAEGAELRWICDRDEARVDLGRRLAPGARSSTSLGEVLADDDVEAVVVAIHPPENPEVARQVLEAGKHLFLEKPMALSLPEAEEIARIAARTKRVLMIGLTYRYNELISEAKRILESGVLGRLHACFSERSGLVTTDQHTNVLWSLAPHDASILQHLFHEDPTSVEVFGSCSGRREVTDSAWVRMYFPQGIETRVFLSWVEPKKRRRLMLFGSERTLVLDEMADEQDMLRLFPAVPEDHGFPWTEGDHGFEVPEPPVGAVAERVPPGHRPEPLLTECRHFLECVRTGATPRTGPAEGLAMTRLVARMQRSLDLDGAPVGEHDLTPSTRTP